MRLLLPIILALAGLVAGAGAGFLLRPLPPESEQSTTTAPQTDPEFFRLNNQFIVPVVEGGQVSAMVILSLSLELGTGGGGDIFRHEPKLRDAFLRVLFDHANSGGFSGVFTDNATVLLLRRALLEAAHTVVGAGVRNVLITDLVRQDM